MAQLNENTPPLAVSPITPFFAKSRIIARPGFNRWLVPPAALAVHLCIGMAYGFSVFWLPMSQLIGGTHPCSVRLRCHSGSSYLPENVTGKFRCWVGPIPCFCFPWLRRGTLGKLAGKVGPRLVSLVATLCWCGGLLLSALAIYSHQLWLLWLGAG